MLDYREPSWKRWIVPIPNYLNSQQCDDLVNIGRSIPPMTSEIGEKGKQDINLNIRKSQICFIPRVEKFKFLYDRLLFDCHKMA